jgi:hypothetical protein
VNEYTSAQPDKVVLEMPNHTLQVGDFARKFGVPIAWLLCKCICIMCQESEALPCPWQLGGAAKRRKPF